MMISKKSDRQLAYAVLRFSMGLSIFIHGVSRMGANYEKFVAGTNQMLAATPLPDWSVDAMAHAIPFIEMVVGALLFFGLFTRVAALAGSALMMALIVGAGLAQRWETVSIQMLYVLIYFLLLFLLEYNCLALDKKLNR